MNFLKVKESGQASTCITPSDKNTVAKVNHRDIIRKRRHSCFEWTQLIATICIPLIIAIYSIIANNKNESIAVADRLKDMDIALADRLNEITIAEQSRQKDRDLAADQQRENILVEYQKFLANLLLDNGIALNLSSAAKAVAKSMTLTTLSQLDMGRRSVLFRSLYTAKLITLKTTSTQSDVSILDFGHIDLSDLTFGSLRNSPDERPRYRYIDWYYLYLPYATLTNASFRHALLDCATFSMTNMDSIDLSFAAQGHFKCFGTLRDQQADFGGSSLVNASFYNADFRFADFSLSDLTLANMRKFYCRECTFFRAKFFQADLSFALIFHAFVLDKERLNFDGTNLSQVFMHSAHFRSMRFTKSDWSNAQASQMKLWNCTFTNAIMENCSFTKSNIQGSVFQNASLLNIDFSDAELYNVSFVNSDMRSANMSYIKCDCCDFTNVTLQSAVLKNASLRYSNFSNCHVSTSQLEEAIDLFGSTLPNGTVVGGNDYRYVGSNCLYSYGL